ncbi:MAG: UPF0280 family protein [Minwuiales bacterium]|nr:UPF0280 family protein [Minwuiales bacterium]
MTGRAQSAMLPDGRRLHLQHGPIDIVAEAFGPVREVAIAYGQAIKCFESVLDDLVEELDVLRTPAGDVEPLLRGPVARRMAKAVRPHRPRFVTPMAAVAGAVADEVLAAMVAGRDLLRAYVNNGGDIAVYLADGQRLTAGIVDNQDAPRLNGDVALSHDLPVRGLATSGWRGRSHSLGIADAVTVLARDAAAADVAATLIGNAVNVGHPAVERRPANELRDDTDLGDLLVTTNVWPLPGEAIEAALEAGADRAEQMLHSGLCHGAYIALQGVVRTVGSHAGKPGISVGALP